MHSKSVPIRTRFAPSPTGFLHIGGARTALFCQLAARATGGEFVLRIEDTDRERSTQASVQAILDGMAWLGLDYDEGPYYQSERRERYQEAVGRLLEAGLAYRCYCSRERLEGLREAAMAAGEKPRYDGYCRDRSDRPEGIEPVIRFRNPLSGSVAFEDRVRGRIEVENAELDDLVIVRADGTPTYNFAVVVDDIDMRINLVIRGDDHINNTPRQINIYRALGAEPPEFAHVPMILGDDGQRLSKRHGAVGVMAWREKKKGDQEVFSRQELIDLFRIEDVNRKASRFDTEKLKWLNQHYLREGDRDQALAELLWHMEQAGFNPASGPEPSRLLGVQAERFDTLTELVEQSRSFYQDFDDFEPGAAKKHLRPVAAAALTGLAERLAEVDEWEPDALQRAIQETADALGIGFGKIGMPLRVALTGHGQSPAINQTLWLVGRERSLARIEHALDWIAARAAAGA